MTDLRFTWDPGKAQVNERKHGVSFEEASTVFFDEEAILIDDPDHSADEDRFLLLGLSSRVRLLTVCHCVVESEGDVLRPISARKATKREQTAYVSRYRG